ncbi:MAG: hypothetical protein ACJAS1_004119 [Oleiphilaceae bacterium]|jgi:hypothetical protein
MVTIDADAFLSAAKVINSKLGRVKRSSLHTILTELGTGQAVQLSPDKVERIQEAICFVPHAKQLKYAKALKILETAGLTICGRPDKPTMNFESFREGAYSYVGLGANGGRMMATLSPGSLHHVFDFKWTSSTGNMPSLKKCWTREHIKFRSSPQESPFNQAMGDVMEFHWGETKGADFGFGRDDHSIKPPQMICRYPFTEGACIAEQWYQYSFDGQNWKNIPGAAYLIHKGVRRSRGNFVFYFKKTNWAPHNTKGYNFEAEYPLAGPLENVIAPDQQFNRTSGTAKQIVDYGRLISRK